MAKNDNTNADGKTIEDLATERGAAAEEARKAEAAAAQADADAAVVDAKAAADRVGADDPAPKAAGKGAGSDPKMPGGESLHDHQIAEGQAPIAPGPEKPVDLDDAQRAKENRGR